MAFQYNPIYKGHTIVIIDTIVPGQGFKARFSVHKGEDISHLNTAEVPLKREGVIDEIFNSPDDAKRRAVERAHEWIDTQPRE